MNLPHNFGVPGQDVVQQLLGDPRLERNVIEGEVATTRLGGKDVEVKNIAVTRETETGFDTEAMAQMFSACCGCIVSSILMLVECQLCGDVVCRTHSLACPRCRVQVCMRCSKEQEQGQLFCLKCDSKESWRKLKTRILSVVWVSRDERA